MSRIEYNVMENRTAFYLNQFYLNVSKIKKKYDCQSASNSKHVFFKNVISKVKTKNKDSSQHTTDNFSFLNSVYYKNNVHNKKKKFGII